MYTLKKSLGQHFLTDENICRKIVSELREMPFQRLLEIGPGGGALTRYLLRIPGIEFLCVELDTEKVQWLSDKFPELKNRIIHQDFLKMDQPFRENFAVIGNFPYNISTQILFKLLEWRNDLDFVLGMFQKEVAQRVVSKEGNKVYGVLSVLIQTFFRVEYLFEVGEHCFQPPPKVKSAVIRLTPWEKEPAYASKEAFFLLVKTAFSQRRKTLRNAVKSLFPEEVLRETLFGKRAEQLAVQEFLALTFRMK